MDEHRVSLKKVHGHVVAFEVNGLLVNTIDFGYVNTIGAPMLNKPALVPPVESALTRLEQWAAAAGVGLLVDDSVRSYLKYEAQRLAVFGGSLFTEVPAELAEQLYAHQVTGVKHALANTIYNDGKMRLLIGDDPRLGKSAQALSALSLLKGSGPILILCPKALMRQWADYVDQWLPRRVPIILNLGGNVKKRLETLDAAMHLAQHDHYVFITNWEFITQPGVDLTCYKWFAVIGDEAHRLKNKESHVTKAMQKLCAKQVKHVLLLSATFVERGSENWWAPLNIVAPWRFSSYWRFVGQYVKTSLDFYGFVQLGKPQNTDLMQAELAPFVIQRRADDVGGLPATTNETLLCTLDDWHREFYNEFEHKVRVELTDAALTIPNRAARIVRLRQACIHPAMLDAALWRDFNISKLEVMTTLLDETIPQGAQVIVYCNFVDGCEIARRVIGWREGQACVYAGQGSAADPQVITDFQQGKYRVLVTTPQKGGVGLNLFNADYCIFLDTPWSTIDVRQAQERIRAMGKQTPVGVYKLVAAGTIDEYVERVVRRKLENADEAAITDQAISWLTGFAIA